MVKFILQPGVEMHTLHSENLSQDLLLFVKLPFAYQNENKNYPILYCLDGNYYFPFYSAPSFVFEAPWNDAKKIIIVGVGYAIDDDRMKGLAQIVTWRTRDFSPVQSRKIKERSKNFLKTVFKEDMEIHTGGAEMFLRSLCDEVIPFVERNYRTDNQNRGLAGYSLGGTFGLYTLFQKSHYFQNYFVGSPWIWQELFDKEKKFAESHQDLQARVFMSLGSEETNYLEDFTKIKECLESRAYPRLDLDTQIFEGEDHNSCIAPAISRALRWFYYSN
jgi:predicted alpha/beta superfamily hydrolase